MSAWREMYPRFIYRGNAVGLAGTVRGKGNFDSLNLASLSLPVIGGAARETIKERDLARVLDLGLGLERVRSAAFGRERDEFFETLVTTMGNGFKISDVLGFEEFGVTLHSRQIKGNNGELPIDIYFRSFEDEPDRRGDEHREAFFTIFGRLARVVFDPDLLECNTLEALETQFVKNPKFRRRYAHKFLGRENRAARGCSWFGSSLAGHELPKVNGSAIYSLVERIEWADDNGDERTERVTFDDHVVTIPGFGQVFVGEVVRSGSACRFTHYRVEGSLGKGTFFQKSGKQAQVADRHAIHKSGGGPIVIVVVAEVESNGMSVDPEDD